MNGKWRLGLMVSSILMAVISLFLPWSRMMMVMRKYGPNGKLLETKIDIQGGFWEGYSPFEMESLLGIGLPLVAAGLLIWLGVRTLLAWQRLPVEGGLPDKIRAGWSNPQYYRESPKLILLASGLGALALVIWAYWWAGFRGVPAYGFWVMLLAQALAACSAWFARAEPAQAG